MVTGLNNQLCGCYSWYDITILMLAAVTGNTQHTDFFMGQITFIHKDALTLGNLYHVQAAYIDR